MTDTDKSILLIEDSAAYANLIKRFSKLRQLPFSINQPEVLTKLSITAKAREHSLVACLIDRNLQASVDALEIIDLLRNEVSPDVTIIGISSTDEADMDGAFLSKCDYYCNKNDVVNLLDTIERSQKNT